jgi:hypothetical protein
MCANPYESPSPSSDGEPEGDERESGPPATSTWRVLIFVACLAVAIACLSIFVYGLFQLDVMGWPQTPLQLTAILVALAMFVQFGAGTLIFGLGLLSRSRRAQVTGVAASLLSVLVYVACFYLAHR